jgi:hypothetical protein
MRLNKASCLFQHPADVSLSWSDVRLDELRQGDQIQPLPPELGLFLTVFVEQHPDPNKAKFHVSKGNHIHRRCKQLNGDLPKGPKQLVNRCPRRLRTALACRLRTALAVFGLLRSRRLCFVVTVLAGCQFSRCFCSPYGYKIEEAVGPIAVRVHDLKKAWRKAARTPQARRCFGAQLATSLRVRLFTDLNVSEFYPVEKLLPNGLDGHPRTARPNKKATA